MSLEKSLYLALGRSRLKANAVVQDKILCFVCAVKGVERTFASYYELQDHLYKDHDMNKDPAMEIFAKEKAAGSRTSSTH